MNCQNLQLPRPLDGLLHLNREQAAMINHLQSRRQPWRGLWNGQALEVLWEPAAPVAATWVAAHWGQAPLRLSLPDALLSHLGTGSAQGSVEAMALEAALLPLIEPLEAASGQSLRLEPASPGFVPFVTLHCTVRLHGSEPWPVTLALGADAAQRLALFLERLPGAPAALETIPLPARLSIGQLPLTLSEARSLRDGDILLLGAALGPLALHCAGRQAAVRRDGMRLTLLEPFRLSTSRTLPTMSHTPEAEAADATLDELELTLSCQVGHLTLNLGQLRALGEGSVLELAGRDDAVDLLVNGRRLGHGELVRIGDGLGVRVLSLAGL